MSVVCSFMSYAIFHELCDQMRFEVDCAKLHHRVIPEGLYVEFCLQACYCKCMSPHTAKMIREGTTFKLNKACFDTLWLLLGVENTGHVTIEHHLVNLLFSSFYVVFYTK